MNKLNWKKNQAQYIRKPLFDSYGAFKETREVLVDCSFGVNPLKNLYPDGEVAVDVADYGMYPGGGPHYSWQLADYILSRWPNLKAEVICFSGGSQGAICSLAKVLGGSKTKIRGFIPQFLPALLEFSITGSQVDAVRLKEPDFQLNAEILLDGMQDDCTALYLDNPNNPTGHALPLKEIEQLAEECAQRGTLLIVDEAYADFVDDENSAFNLEQKNIICLRSFSKGCGLAGLRVGYIVIRDPELRRVYYDLGQHFSCSALAADVASRVLPGLDLKGMRNKLAALKKQAVDFMLRNKEFSICETHGQTPIVLLRWERSESLYDALMNVGIQAEPGHFFGIGDNAVRFRIPGENDYDLFCQQWSKAFG